MKTPKEKAEELFDKFYAVIKDKELAKQTIFIAIAEVVLVSTAFEHYYWKEVQKQIQLL